MNSDNFTRFVKKYDMLPPGARVLCAVSGGADSVCLLHLLAKMPEITVVGAHYNHRLRGEESDRDEDFVRRLCARLGVKFIRGEGDVSAFARENGLGCEEAARRLRYEFLESAARAENCGRIATAHNANDNAETVLLNLARGAGLRGLCGIPPVRGMIVRPLLGTTREEIEEYLRENGLSHVEDSTNAADDYSRNRLRHQVTPVLREINSGAVMNIFRTTESLRRDEEYLASCAREFIDKNLENGSLPVFELMREPYPVRMRIFRQLCGPSLAEGHAQAIHMLCCSRAVSAETDVPGMRVVKERGRLYFSPPEPICLMAHELVPDGRETELENGMKIICEHAVFDPEIHNSFNILCFKSESICGRIFVTARLPGDSIRLAGRGCTKQVRRLLAERGIQRSEREAVPVFRDGLGVIAVYGFGCCERCRCEPGDNIIKIEVSHGKRKEEV